MYESNQKKLVVLLIVFLISLVGSQLSSSGQAQSQADPEIESPVFEVKNITQAPQPISRPRPAYPVEMRKAGTEGIAVIVAVIDRNGNVRKLIDVKATNKEFAYSAAQAVKKWKFSPGVKDGTAVNCKVRLRIPFKIRNNR